jgi:hypothetical protein
VTSAGDFVLSSTFSGGGDAHNCGIESCTSYAFVMLTFHGGGSIDPGGGTISSSVTAENDSAECIPPGFCEVFATLPPMTVTQDIYLPLGPGLLVGSYDLETFSTGFLDSNGAVSISLVPTPEPRWEAVCFAALLIGRLVGRSRISGPHY